MDILYIISELKKYFSVKTDEALAEKLGVNRGNIATWKSRNTIDVKQIVTNFPEINANWLLTGKGKMIIKADYSFQTDSFTLSEPEMQYMTLLESIKDKNRIIELLEEEIKRLKEKNKNK